MLFLKRLAQIFVCLWIFSIPTSLGLHWNKSAGLVSGILVDYRIPTLSLSTILFACFVMLNLFQHLATGSRNKFGMTLQKTMISAIIFTLLFQSGIALYQFRFQKSLTGYIPFGEVNFASPQIAKGTFFNGVIYKLPYGTTVHPNILAGFMVIAFLILVIQKTVKLDHKYLALLFLDVALIGFITQSLTATLALILGITLIYMKHLRFLIILIPIFSAIFFSNTKLVNSSNPSLSRRAQLEQIAISMIRQHPILGIGWNNFTLDQEKYGYVTGATRFLQPAHNAFLLLITELGIFGWLACILISVLIWKVDQRILPLVGALVFISSFDHYLLTLTTGRMLVILCGIIGIIRFHSLMDKTRDF